MLYSHNVTSSHKLDGDAHIKDGKHEYLETSSGFRRFFFLLLDLNDVKASGYPYTVISDTHLWL